MYASAHVSVSMWIKSKLKFKNIDGKDLSNMLKLQYISADYELEWLKASLGA